MRIPETPELFRILYEIAADGAREETLLGSGYDQAMEVFRKTRITADFPNVYLEFPLAGEPSFDLLIGYDRCRYGERFTEGNGYGYQRMFDFLSSLGDGHSMACGFEMDLSSGITDRPAVYFQHYGNLSYVKPFLESVQETGRLDDYLHYAKLLAPEWKADYIGLFPQRTGSPTRIGGYLSEDEVHRCISETDRLAVLMKRIGFPAWNDDMQRQCLRILSLAPSADVQFDIQSDGSLSDTFGLAVSFNEVSPKDSFSCMQEGFGRKLMEMFESWGIADRRWQSIAQAVTAKGVPVQNAEGKDILLGLLVTLNYAKVKFRG